MRKEALHSPGSLARECAGFLPGLVGLGPSLKKRAGDSRWQRAWRKVHHRCRRRRQERFDNADDKCVRLLRQTRPQQVVDGNLGEVRAIVGNHDIHGGSPQLFPIETARDHERRCGRNSTRTAH
jgi:hypothetical protein